jgi:hypothetical protein
MTMDVSLELATADESAPQAQLLLEACDVAMRPARCVLGRDERAAAEGTAIAIVRWGGDHTEARIEVGLRMHGVATWRKRTMSFSRADPEDERWRTVGYAVATLVGEGASGEKSKPTGGDGPSPTASPNSGHGGQDSDRGEGARAWVDAQFVLAAGVPGFALAPGGEMRFSSVVLCHRCFVSVALQGTFQRWALDTVSVLQGSASWGGGVVVLRLPRLDLAVRAEALLDLIDATGIDPTTGNAGSGRQWGVGFAEWVDGVWMWSTRVGLVAGVGFREMTAATELTGHGQGLVHLPAVHFDSAAGLRWAFP